jgi:predicted ATP-dependent serine protease
MAINLDATGQLLEREHELEVASTAVARAAGGSGAVLLIEGPAGVGKSKLLGGIRAAGRHQGMRVLEARGAALERERTCYRSVPPTAS